MLSYLFTLRGGVWNAPLLLASLAAVGVATDGSSKWIVWMAVSHFRHFAIFPVDLSAFENRQDIPAVAKETGSGFTRICQFGIRPVGTKPKSQ